MSENEVVPQSGGKTDMGMIAYICFAISPLTAGIGAIAGVIIAYMQQDKDRGTWRESHNVWLIRTFWVGLAGSVIGWITSFILIGWLVLLALAVWYIVRLVKGWMAYDRQQPLANPESLMFD
jgi:uncharacterized membrane protein